jgi:DNA ligase-1
MDGEATVTDLGICHPRLCNLTSSAMRREDGTPDITWNVFDLLTPEALIRGYADRIKMVHEHLANQHAKGLCLHAQPIEYHIVNSGEEVLELDSQFLDRGFEGTVYRLGTSLHKQGRSTLKQGGLIRIKRFIEEEVMVTGFTEGDKNENEKQTNELGHSFRTSHKDNKVPNGMIGNILGYFLSDSREVTAGAGCMTHEERKYYFDHPEELIGQIIKVKHFPKGVKDKARFPTFQSFRDDSDMSEG